MHILRGALTSEKALFQHVQFKEGQRIFTASASIRRSNPDIENLMYRMMSRELAQRPEIINMLGMLSAEARVARFVISLTDRFVRMGYSGKIFNLRMTRQEIGSYQGLTMETVSRTLSAFNEAGLISVQQRCIAISDPGTLRALRRVSSSPAV